MTSPVYAVPDHVVPQMLDNELVLLDLSRGEYFGLDDVGSRIWTLLERGTAQDAIIEAIVDAYDAPQDRVREDVEALIAELLSQGLVQQVGA